MTDDLFSHEDERAAERAVDEARAQRLRAVYRAGAAPVGQVRKRRAAVVTATHEALAAELELARVRQERNKH